MKAIPSTNRPARFSATDIYRVEDGLVADEWNSLEEYGLLAEIGARSRPRDQPAD